MTHVMGMPGIGGSLGECALCGGNFVKEIMLNQTVQTFRVPGVREMLCGHDSCIEKATATPTFDIMALPEASPLRKALIAANTTPPEAPTEQKA